MHEVVAPFDWDQTCCVIVCLMKLQVFTTNIQNESSLWMTVVSIRVGGARRTSGLTACFNVLLLAEVLPSCLNVVDPTTVFPHVILISNLNLKVSSRYSHIYDLQFSSYACKQAQNGI